MKTARFFAAVLPLLVLLAGCSTDDMVPRAPVGNETSNVRPSSDLTRPVPASDMQAPVETTEQLGPQNSLEAQARALQETGTNPVASGPDDNAVVVDQPAETTQTATKPKIDEEPANLQDEAPQTAQAAQRGTIRFLPIIGAPVKAVTPLSRTLGRDARAAGLTIKSSKDPTAGHILKGYLSAYADGQDTVVTYVWDVLDAGGQRLNRIQGQQKVPGTAADPWSAVPDEVMQTIGSETIRQYVAWSGG